jgi:hypothetical protein
LQRQGLAAEGLAQMAHQVASAALSFGYADQHPAVQPGTPARGRDRRSRQAVEKCRLAGGTSAADSRHQGKILMEPRHQFAVHSATPQVEPLSEIHIEIFGGAGQAFAQGSQGFNGVRGYRHGQ